MKAKKTNKNIESFSVIVFLSVFLAIFPVIADAGTALPKSVAIATMPKGSMSSILGGGLAKIITTYTPMTAVDRPYTGYQIWVPLTDKGSVDMSIGSINEYSWAYRGLENYKERLKNLRVLCGGNSLVNCYVANPATGIKTIKDFKGKRIAFDPTSKSISKRPLALMRAAGLDPEKDLTLIPIAGVPAGLAELGEGRVDASWCAIGTAVAKELYAKFGGLTWVSLVSSYDDPGAKWIRENSPGEDVVFIKAGIVPEVKNDYWGLDANNFLVTNIGMGDEAIYLITKAIWEHQKELVAIYPAFGTWHENMVTDRGWVPYHPGAVRFYKEVGVWSDKMEKLQQKRLAE